MDRRLKKMEDPYDILKVLQPDTVWTVTFGKGHFSNEKVHIRAIVDDYQIVYCRWHKRKKYWVYMVESMYYFWYRKEHLTQVKGVRATCH